MGLIFVVLFSLGAPGWVHQIIYLFVILTAGTLAISSKIRKDISGLSGACKVGCLFTFLSALISVCFIATGHVNPADTIQGCSEVALRNPLHPMTVDNGIQYYLGLTLANHLDVHTFDSVWGVWIVNIFDRPPLMGMLYAIELLAAGSSSTALYWDYQILGIVLNSLYLIPLYFLLSRLFQDRRMAGWIAAATLLNIFIFTNTWYTWSKLMSAFFILTALSCVLSCNDFRWRNAFSTGVCCGLAILSHGCAILSIPCLMLYQGVALWRRDKSFRRVFVIGGLIIIFLATLLVVQLPWEIYKVRNSPDRQYLLKYHYFSNITFNYTSTKDINPDSVNVNGHKFYDIYSIDKFMTTTSLNDWIKAFFQSTSLQEQFQHRLHNLSISLYDKGFAELFSTIMSGGWNSYFSSDYWLIFFNQLFAIGPLNVLFNVLFLVIFFIRGRIASHDGRNTLNTDMPRLLILLSFVIISLIFNILLKWSLPKNHELPYLELVLSIALMAGFAFYLHPFVRIVLMTFIGLRFFHYVYCATVAHGYSIFDFFSIAMVTAVIAVLLIPVFPLRRQSP
jgi:4-amino-4-deoxy-L-arabinose transferase-like glycosyltransferase